MDGKKDEFISIKEAAEMLGMHPARLKVFLKSDKGCEIMPLISKYDLLESSHLT